MSGVYRDLARSGGDRGEDPNRVGVPSQGVDANDDAANHRGAKPGTSVDGCRVRHQPGALGQQLGYSLALARARHLRSGWDELQKDQRLLLAGVRSSQQLVHEFDIGDPRHLLPGNVDHATFIRALSQRGNALGLIATHDLELTKLAEEIRGIANYHFCEEISDGRMVFDYLLRSGPCPTTNALKIMQIEGLPVES